MTIQILTPKGLVDPEEALHVFIARAGCTAAQLKTIFEQLCEKAIDFARRACAYVLREQIHYPVGILEQAHTFMMRTSKKPSNGVEMAEKMNEMGLALHAMRGGKRKVNLTFYSDLSAKALREVIENPLVRFDDPKEAASLLANVEISGWAMSPRSHTVTLHLFDESSLWSLTGLLSGTAESVT